MSIFSEYEEIKKDIGEDKWNAIDKYIEFQRPDLRLDQIIYYPDNWIAFEEWYYKDTGKSVEVIDVWKFEDDEYRANVEIGEGKCDFGNIIVSYTEKDIRNLTGNINKELSTKEIKNAIVVLTLRDFDTYKKLPKISEVSDILREIYNTVKESIDSMCFITYDDWNECYANDYTLEDIENLKNEIEKYKLNDCIEFDEGDCKIVGYADLERAFIDDRKEPIKEITTLDFLKEEKEMIEHNLFCYSEGNFICKAKKGYENEFNKERQKLVIINKLIEDEKQKSIKKEDRER